VIAVVPVRAGRLPAGSDATVDEADGRVLVIGEGALVAAASIRVEVRELRTCEAGAFAPGSWAAGLAELLSDETVIVLPGSPDGRDLAGRLAGELGRPCVAWCTEVSRARAVTTRHEGAVSVTVPLDGAGVTTLVPRAVADPPVVARRPDPTVVALAATASRDATVLGVDDADPAELDLSDAARIVAGGVGLGGPEEFAALAEVAAGLGASVGATRPIADRGIVGHERQIGTTGVTVDPILYVAFGISGAVQHTAGLGTPARIVAVNTDAACPMMAMADLAVVADAASTLRAIRRRLAEAT
jgi:electron transfer flavoprotein alpha subunit